MGSPSHPPGRLSDLVRDPSEAANDQRLSKLGDALLNFIYSLSLSYHSATPEGRKIPNKILARALEASSHRELIPRRSDKHRKGDIVEAVFACAWLRGMFEIREAARFLSEKNQTKDQPIDSQGYSEALAELMDGLLSEMGMS